MAQKADTLSQLLFNFALE